MKVYKDTFQRSRLIEVKHKFPKYGKSTTDPTYYEPTATRIANMYKSASNSVAMYDYNDSDKFPDIRDVHIMPGRKQYMEREEISQEINEITQNLKNETDDRKSKEAATKEAIELAKAQSKAILESNGSGDGSENNA